MFLVLSSVVTGPLGAEEKAKQVETKQETKTEIQADKPHDADQQQAPIATSVPKETLRHVAEGESKHAKEKSEEEGTEFWPPFFGYRLKVTDTLIAVFTAFLFVATVLLYAATKALVRGADKTAERQLRAYVNVSEVYVDQLTRAQHTVTPETFQNIDTKNPRAVYNAMFYGFIVRCTIKNSGQTPAKAMCSSFNCSIMSMPSQGACDFEDTEPPEGPIDLGPGVTYELKSRPIPVDTIQTLVGGAAKIYAWGWIEYDDIFADTPRRRSEFCLEIAVGSDHNGALTFADKPYGRFNGSDEHCQHKPKTPKAL